MTHLNTKERYLLEDQKAHEEICIKKYSSYANQAQDPQLKQLFSNHAQHEQQHYNTINQILSGQVPNLNQQQGQQQQQAQQQSQPQQTQQAQQAQQAQQLQASPGRIQVGITNQKDADLCNDMLMTEKYVSSTYDTAIFEFRDHNIRNALNHIQKEEQEHGEAIFAYMQSKGMYNPPQ